MQPLPCNLIYSIKYFLQVRKTPRTNILLSIAFSIFSIKLITECAVKFYFGIQIAFYIEPFGHSKIPLTFYAQVFLLFYQDLIAG